MNSSTKFLTAITLSVIPLLSFAAPQNSDDYVAVTASFGGRYSGELTDSNTDQDALFSDDLSYALSMTWDYSDDGEGELLYSNAKHTLSTESDSTDLYISYLHFGGKTIFRNAMPFSTSFGLGVGATLFIPDTSEYDIEYALSGNVTLGARYQLSPQWALKSDLRVYGTLLDTESTWLCSDNKCLVNVDGDVFVQAELLAGVEYRF